jgi:Paf1
MYAQNPYGAAVQDISESKTSATRATAAAAAATEAAGTTAEKQRDAVLSRVPKRAAISKPPVKFFLAPRYRFAIPEPPTDLKMLRGQLESSNAAASQSHKLELDAKKVALVLYPSFSLLTDLVMPAQYAHRTSEAPLSAEDQVVLESVDTQSATKPATSVTQLGSRSGQKSSGTALGASNSYAIGGNRIPIPPPNRSKQTTAHPWMRRMSYDEYFSGSTTHDPRRQAALLSTDAALQDSKKQNFAASRKKEALDSFDKANIRSLRHPDKAKANLKVVHIAPVFRDVSDSYNEWVSMQFDRMGPMDKLPRFERSAGLGEKAFKSAVTISVADADDKKFLSCYVPDDETLESKNDDGVDDLPIESHERVREFAIREAGFVAAQAGQGSSNTIRAKRTFVMTVIGEEDSSVVCLSEVPSAFLLAQRQGILEPLSKPRLELVRNPDTSKAKRQRKDTIVGTLCE